MNKKTKKTSKTIKFIYILAVLSGLMTILVYLYPTISDAWNKYVAYKTISEYVSQKEDEKDYSEIIEAAQKYNQDLFEHSANNITEYAINLSGDTSGNEKLSGEVINPDKYYESQINIFKNGMMGYIDIESINVSLPIYHYASEEVLSNSIGHLYGSSLPIGGEDTHAVLTGHTGLMTAKLFTDLDKVEIGDVFTIHVLDKSLNYEVDQIKTVLPYEIDDLSIEEGQDYVTLITCTPYGVNDHRLLVRGHRIADNIEKQEVTPTEQTQNIVDFPIKIFILVILIILIGIILIIKIIRKD